MGEYYPPQQVKVFPGVPPELLELLTLHLPTSLTLLRRLQFAAFKDFTKPDARIVFSSDTDGFGDVSTSTKPRSFAVAYVEFSGGPDAQMFMYSSLEHADKQDGSEHEMHIANVVRELIRLRKEYGGKLVYGNSVLLGSLHSKVRKILVKSGRVTPRPSGDYDKWLFRMESVPEPQQTPEGMQWGKASLEDCRLVASRTDIPRPPESLVKLPGLMLKLVDGTPVCWAFIALDGSLISLHCEAGYRRRGFAKMLAAKLLRQAFDGYSDGRFTGSEWLSADVAPDNEGSRAICRSLNAVPRWSVSWVLLDLSESA